jgi:hypothetical protein
MKKFKTSSNTVVYLLSDIKERLVPVLKKYGLSKAAIFGSYARNEANATSDIDLLIQMDETFDLEKYLKFEEDVRRALDKNVDIVEYRCINNIMRDDILKEAVEIYGYPG